MHQKVMRGKLDIPQARNTFHHCLGNGKVLDSGYDVSTANTIALLWKISYNPDANARRLIAAEYWAKQFGVQPYPRDFISGCILRKISRFLALLLNPRNI